MYTTQQAAKILGNKHSSTVRHIIRRGLLKAKKFSTVWMISKKDLNAYLKKRGRPLLR